MKIKVAHLANLFMRTLKLMMLAGASSQFTLYCRYISDIFVVFYKSGKEVKMTDILQLLL